MKTMFVLLLPLAVALTACQSSQMRAPDESSPHHDAATAAGTSGSAGSGTASGSGSTYGGETAGIFNRKDMCARSQRIMNAHTPEERQALMEQAMPDMSQEMRERHLTMMRQGCD